MALYLGIDTSNYTTSAALYDSDGGGYTQKKRLLPVGKGEMGLRQSDAVFSHVRQLGETVEALFAGGSRPVAAVGVSVSPRDVEGSYMPCFLAGEMAARTAAAAMGVPLYAFSHQAGHVAAALLGAGQTALMENPFLAFHISGGTTECLHVAPDREKILRIHTVAHTLDLNAGQAVDRVGGMLGLPFPAGPHLEALAGQSGKEYNPKPTIKELDCCLSGLENQCRRKLEAGEDGADVARYCLDFLAVTFLEMTRRLAQKHPGLPLVYAGGVMSNQLIRKALEERFACSFAPPELSADNAVGTALLCAIRHCRAGEDGL